MKLSACILDDEHIIVGHLVAGEVTWYAVFRDDTGEFVERGVARENPGLELAENEDYWFERWVETHERTVREFGIQWDVDHPMNRLIEEHAP